MQNRNNITAEDDDLPCLNVGSWAEEKYDLVYLYTTLFSTGMKLKWKKRVYIDLYAGPGYSRVTGTNTILKGSPLLALGVRDPFDQYIFCESDPHFMDALQRRVNRIFPKSNVKFVSGDCNECIGKVIEAIPPYSTEQNVLSFCFVDPFDISIKFSTVQELAVNFVDFLFLLALHMDANRNVLSYMNERNRKIDEFLGLPDWRDRWKVEEAKGVKFPHFLAQEYCKQMESLKYLPMPLHQMKVVRSDVKNLPLYHLALFSRHSLAHTFWKDVLKYSTRQRSLFPS